MDDKPTYDELEQKVEELEDEVAKLKKLKKHWQILSSAIGDSSEGIAIIDLDGNLNYLNNTFAELHGYSVNDLLGKHFSIFHTPQQMPSVKAANRQVKEEGTFIGEIWHTRRDGTVFPAIMHNSLIRGEEGKPTYWLGTLRDISEQKKLEENLLESGNKYKSLFEGSLSPIIVFDRDGIVLMINSAGARNLGLPVEACIGKPITELLPDLDEVYSSIFQQVIDTGVKITREDLVELSLGPRWFWSTLEPVSNIHGKRYGVQIISYDITKRKQTEMALFESEEWHRNFLENLSDVVYEADDSGNIRYANKIAESLTGVPLKNIIGKPFLPFFDKKSQKIAVDVYLRTLNGESPKYELTFNNGKIAHFKNKPRRNKDGKIIGVFGVARDVTELKIAEEAVRTVNERLEKEVKERTSELKGKNTALRVLLDQRKNDKELMEKTIMLNIKKLINPNLARLKKSSLNDRQKSNLAILEANLNEIISPFESSLSSEYLKLTPTEMQVANFIKHNATSKEIASLLGLSRRTIDTHRHNIRKKIGIRGKGVNLKTYLSSLT